MSETSPPILYTKDGCPWCEEAMDFLDRNEIPYQKREVTSNAAAMRELVAVSGQSKAPTLKWGDEVLADFGLEELRPFLAARGIR